jgi:hypothetical protein
MLETAFRELRRRDFQEMQARAFTFGQTLVLRC